MVNKVSKTSGNNEVTEKEGADKSKPMRDRSIEITKSTMGPLE